MRRGAYSGNCDSRVDIEQAGVGPGVIWRARGRSTGGHPQSLAVNPYSDGARMLDIGSNRGIRSWLCRVRSFHRRAKRALSNGPET